MNAKEIVDRLERGERVVIDAENTGEFMLECERQGISCAAISMKFQYGRCAMRISKANRGNHDQRN